ncbi:MAG: hypothetical protein ACE5G1_11910, partial [bacterium]
GQLIRRGTVEELTSETKSYRIDTSKVSKKILDGLQPHTLDLEQQTGFIQLTVSSHKKLNAIIDYLREHDVDIKSVIPHRQSLEESFIEILKKDIVDE